MINSEITEKRKHRRFQVQDNAFVELDGKPITIGQLIDISRGGLAFRYAANCTPPNDLLELNIYSLGSDWVGLFPCFYYYKKKRLCLYCNRVYKLKKMR